MADTDLIERATKAIDLLPCPFCGGTPELMDTLPSGSYWYRCEECCGETEGGKTHAEAIAAWNRRAPSPCSPTPPGWPDPLESPQTEAIRNGKLDDTEIRNLFDSMEREFRLHRERAANPAQGGTETTTELIEAGLLRGDEPCDCGETTVEECNDCCGPVGSPQPANPAQREVAWLMERKYPVNSIGATEPRWYAERSNGDHWWTPVSNDAKRFMSKAEAEASAAYRMIASDRTVSVTEHIWTNAPANPVQVTDAMVKDATTEFLSHKGERPWRVTRRGAELWEDYAPAMRAALTAAIGAGGEPFQLVEESDDVGTQMVVASAIGAGGQAVDSGPVAWQWRALENGEPRSAWKGPDEGDRAGWEALALRQPEKFTIEKRPLYTHPAPSGQAVTDLTYGKKLIAEAITHHFGERDERLFSIADDIACRHIKRGLFESLTRWTIRKIKLRQEIYEALVAATFPAGGLE